MAHCIRRAALAVLLAIAPGVWAQNYPSRPIRLIVTTPPGGLADVLGRIVAQALGQRLGQTVLVDNRSGATTQIGVESTIQAPPDGYTLLLGTSEMTMLPALKKRYAYSAVTDLTPVALVANSWTVFAVNPKVPATTLPELVSYAKAHPGAIRYGTNGIGGSLHLAVELLRVKTGVELVHVPYKGGAQAAMDAIAGQIEMVSMGVASTRGRRDQLRVLAQTGPTRHRLLADVPTTAELGMPEVRMDTWFGVMAPAHTQAPVVARLANELEALLQESAIKEKLSDTGCDAAWMPPEAFATFLGEEGKKWARVIRDVGVAPED